MNYEKEKKAFEEWLCERVYYTDEEMAFGEIFYESDHNIKAIAFLGGYHSRDKEIANLINDCNDNGIAAMQAAKRIGDKDIEISALKEENDRLKVCGNCRHGKGTSFDDTRCYGNSAPYLPVRRDMSACKNWEQTEVIENTTHPNR